MSHYGTADKRHRTSQSLFQQRSPRTILAVAAAASFAMVNVWLYRYSTTLEAQFRQGFTDERPWLWPETALFYLLLSWLVVLIICALISNRTSSRKLRNVVIPIGAAGLVALAVNAWLLFYEAFHF